MNHQALAGEPGKRMLKIPRALGQIVEVSLKAKPSITDKQVALLMTAYHRWFENKESFFKNDYFKVHLNGATGVTWNK